MAGEYQSNETSWAGAYIFSALHKYANHHQPTRPQVYQIDDLYILHTASGGTSYVTPPTTQSIGLPDDPPAPLPVDLSVITLSHDDLMAQLDTCFAKSILHVWAVNTGAHSLSDYTEPSKLRVYQPGDIYAGEGILNGFSLDIGDLFGMLSHDPAHLALEDQTALRQLLYPVIFEENPLDGLDRVIESLEGNSGTDRGLLVGSIERALAGTYQISILLPMAASESAVRGFLQVLAQRLNAAS